MTVTIWVNFHWLNSFDIINIAVETVVISIASSLSVKITGDLTFLWYMSNLLCSWFVHWGSKYAALLKGITIHPKWHQRKYHFLQTSTTDSRYILYYNMVRWISAPSTMHFCPQYDTFWPCGLFTLLQFCKHPPSKITMKLRWVSSVN